MRYQTITGVSMLESDLADIMEIDRLVYHEDMSGDIRQMLKRFRRNPYSFVCIRNDEHIVGYINFFPCTDVLWDEITKTGTRFRDDDIEPYEIEDYRHAPASNNLFILSVAIHPDYQHDRNAVIALSNAWLLYLRELEEDKYPITAIAGTVVSDDGTKFLTQRRFQYRRDDGEGHRVYVCEGEDLRRFLNNDVLYKRET